ncbi:phosphate ABC transporter permease PstA [Tessaracoccus sp. HDW20]|uniref:phosphate ABC transporter permease PstA n=1 Tax=Tessaracoccus coleopterorum TaxID=2714950 RepID=UPI0018D44ACE|nr:phosphate ABC transporter permease PstA [Tessaracoccus coleopterorum]NHB85485.1 phosphate ABC transporter permease PstA [Tessaracoccus coleopterorum]
MHGTIASTQKPRNILTSAQLPKYATLAMLVGSLAVTFGILSLFGITSPAAGIIIGAAVYLVGHYALSAAVEGPRKAKDRLARNVVTGFFILALFPLFSVILGTLSKGLARFDGEFFNSSMRNIVGEGGGAVHAIWGTLIITGLATLISVPIGILAAIFLVEYSGSARMTLLARVIRFFVDVMTGIPSIVAGLFAYTIFSIVLGPGTNNGISGAAALSVLMIPTVVRSTEEMLRLVPNELREASYALGVPKYRTILRIVLPTSVAGIVTGVVLGIARVIGETAPLLVTAGITASMNLNPLSNPMATLPVFVYYEYTTPGADPMPYIDRAWSGALTLIIIVMGLNLIGRLIAWKFAPKAGR